MRPRLLAALVMGFAVAGCVHTGFTRTAGLVVPARPPDCSLDVSFEGPPPVPYVVLGQVGTDSVAPPLFAIAENEVSAMRRVMKQACAIGAQGLMYITANSQLMWVGKGHWKRTTAGAVAFVYVDASGRPLAPPEAIAPPAAVAPGGRGTIGE